MSREDPLEKEMATHSWTRAWKIPWTEERVRLQSMGSQRVGHKFTFTFTFFHCNIKNNISLYLFVEEFISLILFSCCLSYHHLIFIGV